MNEPTDRDRLSGQDLSFLAWESRKRPMLIAVRADFAAPTAEPTLDALRRQLGEKARAEPLLCARLRRPRWRRPNWVQAESIRIEDHVELLPRGDDGTRPSAAEIDAILRRPLDPDRPLWEVWLLPGEPGRGFSLLIKLHHVLIDGVGAVALLERLLGASPSLPARGHRAVSSRRKRPLRWRAMARFVRDQLRRGPATPLNGSPTPLRFRRFDIDADTFDAAATRLGASRNDLVLTCISRALARWLELQPSGRPDTVHAFCPVDLRDASEPKTRGNRISTWYVPLPLDALDIPSTIERIHATTRALRRSGAEHGGDGMARIIERWGMWVAKLGAGLAAYGRAHQLVVSSVTGPRAPVQLLGARLSRVSAYAPLMAGQRLSIAVVKHDGRLCWGITDGTPASTSGHGYEISEALRTEILELEAVHPGEAA